LAKHRTYEIRLSVEPEVPVQSVQRFGRWRKPTREVSGRSTLGGVNWDLTS